MLPPVDDLRQAAFFLPYALLRTNADSALAAKARHMQQAANLWRTLCTCKLRFALLGCHVVYPHAMQPVLGASTCYALTRVQSCAPCLGKLEQTCLLSPSCHTSAKLCSLSGTACANLPAVTVVPHKCLQLGEQLVHAGSAGSV